MALAPVPATRSVWANGASPDGDVTDSVQPAPTTARLVDGRIGGIPGHEQDRQAGNACADSLGQLPPTQAGHDDIGDQQIGDESLLDPLHGFLGVARLYDAVSEAFEDTGGQI